MGECCPPQPESCINAVAAVRAQGVRLVLTDVDGVLTDSHLVYDANGGRHRAFSTRDGAAIQWLIQSGIPVGFISALDDLSTRRRGEDLGVQEFHLGPQNKLETLHSILNRLGLRPDQVAYLGDDLVDLSVLMTVGFSACPSDAAAEVQAICSLVLPQKGGEGFFRAAAEYILKTQKRWDAIVSSFSLPAASAQE